MATATSSDPRTETLLLSSMIGTSASHDVEMIIFDANNDGVMDIAVAETRKGAVLVDGSPKGDTWTKVTVYHNTEAGGWAPQKWWEYGGATSLPRSPWKICTPPTRRATASRTSFLPPIRAWQSSRPSDF